MSINISDQTIAILKNFATINPNVVLKPGGVVKTIAEAKNILASATIAEDFPAEMGIYDLNEFLSVLNLVANPTIAFEENSAVITSQGGGSKVRYFFSDPSILTAPQKDITMPSSDVLLSLTDTDLSAIRKAAAVLGHTELSIIGADGKVTLRVLDTKDSSANTFDYDTGRTTEEEFNFVVNIPNLKLMTADYDIEISKKLISKWTSSTGIEYFIALEKSSTFGAADTGVAV